MIAAAPTKNRHLKLVYWGVFVGSLLLAAWAHYIDPIINPDGVKYVLASQAYLKGEFAIGLAAYKWPAYSLTVALISFLTNLSTETAAILFDAVTRGLAGIAFVKLSDRLGADRIQLVLAALIYLFFPGLNEVQSMIIRDFAYLACFMWMTVFFVQQMTNPTRRNFTGFLILGVMATAYRIEGLVMVFGLLALYLLSGTANKKRRRWGLALFLLAIPVLVYGLLVWIYDGDVKNSWSILTSAVQLMEADLAKYTDSIETEWWAWLVQKLSVLILIFMPFGKLLFNLFEVVTIGYALILLAGFYNKPLVDLSQPRISMMVTSWKWIVGINLLVLTGFVLVKQIVTDRYPLSLALLLMLFIPFAITTLYRDRVLKGRRKATVVAVAVGALLLVNTLEGLDRFSAKHHYKAAGLWIKAQSGSRYKRNKIYSNSRIVDYYAGKPVAEKDVHYGPQSMNGLVLTTRWKLLDFMAINLNRKHKPGFYRNFRYRTGNEPGQIFENDKGDKVLVYDFRKLSERDN